MSKQLKIVVTTDENPTVENEIVITIEGEEATQEQWERINAFMDEHVGGRPGDRGQ